MTDPRNGGGGDPRGPRGGGWDSGGRFDGPGGRPHDQWSYAAAPAPGGGNGAGNSGGNKGVLWALGGLVVVLAVALAGVVGYMLAQGDDPAPSATPAGTTSTQEADRDGWTTPVEPPAEPAAPPARPAQQPSAPTTAYDRGLQEPPRSQSGDLGLSVPMTRPACDGRGIVVLYSAVTPGAYEQEISSALAQNPGASYLRTDMACPSLRQRDENGNVIYAVYRPSGYSQAEVCADVRAAGGAAYGRWLDTTSDPDQLVTC